MYSTTLISLFILGTLACCLVPMIDADSDGARLVRKADKKKYMDRLEDHIDDKKLRSRSADALRAYARTLSANKLRSLVNRLTKMKSSTSVRIAREALCHDKWFGRDCERASKGNSCKDDSYVKENCQRTCKICKFHPCQRNPCSYGGTCINTGDDKYECKCWEDRTGPRCRQRAPQPTEPPRCFDIWSNCDEVATDEKCKNDPRTKEKCERKCGICKPNPCPPERCLHGGSCEVDNDPYKVRYDVGYNCKCTEWYEGRRCERRKRCTNQWENRRCSKLASPENCKDDPEVSKNCQRNCRVCNWRFKRSTDNMESLEDNSSKSRFARSAACHDKWHICRHITSTSKCIREPVLRKNCRKTCGYCFKSAFGFSSITNKLRHNLFNAMRPKKGRSAAADVRQSRVKNVRSSGNMESLEDHYQKSRRDSAECIDEWITCDIHGTDEFCNNNERVQKNCRRTCKKCTAPERAKGKCIDISVGCRGYKSLCNDQTYTEIKEKCPQTCGVCGDPIPEPPPPPQAPPQQQQPQGAPPQQQPPQQPPAQQPPPQQPPPQQPPPQQPPPQQPPPQQPPQQPPPQQPEQQPPPQQLFRVKYVRSSGNKESLQDYSRKSREEGK